jgi:hypothetical protein
VIKFISDLRQVGGFLCSSFFIPLLIVRYHLNRLRKVWRYRMANQRTYIEEGKTL